MTFVVKLAQKFFHNSNFPIFSMAMKILMEDRNLGKAAN